MINFFRHFTFVSSLGQSAGRRRFKPHGAIGVKLGGFVQPGLGVFNQPTLTDSPTEKKYNNLQERA